MVRIRRKRQAMTNSKASTSQEVDVTGVTVSGLGMQALRLSSAKKRANGADFTDTITLQVQQPGAVEWTPASIQQERQQAEEAVRTYLAPALKKRGLNIVNIELQGREASDAATVSTATVTVS